MIWLNAGAEDVRVKVPTTMWVNHGEVVLSTDPKHSIGAELASGSSFKMSARSVVVLRQTFRPDTETEPYD